MKKEVSTIVIYPYEPQLRNGVTLFSEADCSGVSSVYFVESDERNASKVPNKVTVEGFGETRGKTMMVPPEHKVIYNGEKFEGPHFLDD